MTIRLTRPVAAGGRGAAVFVTPRTARRAGDQRHRRHRGAHRRRQQDQDVLAPSWPGCRPAGALPRRRGALPRAAPRARRHAEPGAPAAGGEANPLLFRLAGAVGHLRRADGAFFETLGIPGPLLFLREWGIRLSNPLPPAGGGPQARPDRAMLEVIANGRVVLIGDSGQRDPEVYAPRRPGFPRPDRRRLHSRPGPRPARAQRRDPRHGRAGRGRGRRTGAATDSLQMAERAHAVRPESPPRRSRRCAGRWRRRPATPDEGRRPRRPSLPVRIGHRHGRQGLGRDRRQALRRRHQKTVSAVGRRLGTRRSRQKT